ncbi:Hypothetical protein RG1141_CH16270 [Neorhizobium galegae bv. officinalis bv. officinalis str. HAMBI 1141]|uniref:Uncharacterized protein n=1 Tax=Neorhizobium galegae bv. officinalis bv. officinalis str. HAMBI 1141 TaxID=1028801 RepID=A0A068T9H4_NEOGA|nr:Hypothetical protein RG1141_CH16270 [Neorhizobium galegae bv. officinalis bv. officinalis str. HAMBI 1141]
MTCCCTSMTPGIRPASMAGLISKAGLKGAAPAG